MEHPILPRRTLLAGVLLVLAGGCVSIGPQAAYQLARFDPFTAKPEDIAMAITTDRALRLRTGDILLRITRESRSEEFAIDETFELAVVEDEPASGLDGEIGPGEHVVAARLAAGDRDRFQDVQRRVLKARASETDKARGSIALAVRGGCRQGDAFSGKVPIRTYIRTGPKSDFVPLGGEFTLEGILGPDGLARIPAC